LKLKKISKLIYLACILFGLVCFTTGCGIDSTSTIEALIPIISAIIGIIGTAGEGVLPAESSLIAEGVTLVTNGLNALIVALKTYDANKTAPGALATISAAFTSVQQNLQTLMSAARVKNATVAQEITAVVNSAIEILATLKAYIISKAPTTSN
jgi:hypothetical protein